MDEGSVLKPKDKASQLEGKSFVTQEWFDAYYKGNSLIPQTATGIQLSVLAAIMEDPNLDWEKFANSTFSPEQTDFLARAMAAQHKAKNVKVSTEEYSQTFIDKPQIIKKDRLHDLWSATKAAVVGAVFSYLTGQTMLLSKEDSAEISTAAKFIGGFLYGDRTKELKRISKMIQRFLDKPEARELLGRYRNEFKISSEPERGWNSYYYSLFIELLKKDIEKELGGLPKNLSYLLQ